MQVELPWEIAKRDRSYRPKTNVSKLSCRENRCFLCMFHVHAHVLLVFCVYPLDPAIPARNFSHSSITTLWTGIFARLISRKAWRFLEKILR